MAKKFPNVKTTADPLVPRDIPDGVSYPDDDQYKTIDPLTPRDIPDDDNDNDGVPDKEQNEDVE